MERNLLWRRRFGLFAYGVLAYNILVVLWGAFVRASFSGDGCGDHWPFCNGQVLPSAASAKTVIEFLHRMTTGIDTVVVILMCFLAFRLFPAKHPVRAYSLWSLGFLFVEAILGAGLVLLRYVAHDASAGRAIYLSAHLTNTLLLLSALTITAWLARSGLTQFRLRALSNANWMAIGIALVISVAGAVTALGDTLFPAGSLANGFGQDFASESSFLLRLRIIHPALAVAGAAYLIWLGISNLRNTDDEEIRVAATRVLGVIVLQMVVGAMNISLLAPVWMQITHLLIADVLWIALLQLALESTRAHKSSSAVFEYA